MRTTCERALGATVGAWRRFTLAPIALLILAVLGTAADTPAQFSNYDYDEPPRILKLTRPKYPAQPFYNKVQGTVEIEFVVDEKGRVTDPTVVKSVPGLDEAALECVKKWKFKPAQKQGKPTKARALAPVTFRITDRKP